MLSLCSAAIPPFACRGVLRKSRYILCDPSEHLPPAQNVEKAASIAAEAVKIDDKWPDAYLAQGCVLTAQRQFAEAERVLRQGELLCGGIRTARISAALGHLAKMRLESIADTVGSAADAASPSEATPAELPTDREADKFDGLEHWMASDADNNTHFPYLYMKKYMEGNRGVHCTSTVEVRSTSTSSLGDTPTHLFEFAGRDRDSVN